MSWGEGATGGLVACYFIIFFCVFSIISISISTAEIVIGYGNLNTCIINHIFDLGSLLILSGIVNIVLYLFFMVTFFGFVCLSNRDLDQRYTITWNVRDRLSSILMSILSGYIGTVIFTNYCLFCICWFFFGFISLYKFNSCNNSVIIVTIISLAMKAIMVPLIFMLLLKSKYEDCCKLKKKI